MARDDERRARAVGTAGGPAPRPVQEAVRRAVAGRRELDRLAGGDVCRTGAKAVDRLSTVVASEVASSSTMAQARSGAAARNTTASPSIATSHLGERHVDNRGPRRAESISIEPVPAALRPTATIDVSAGERPVRDAEHPVREGELGGDRLADPLDGFLGPDRKGFIQPSGSARKWRTPDGDQRGWAIQSDALPATTRGSPGRALRVEGRSRDELRVPSHGMFGWFQRSQASCVAVRREPGGASRSRCRRRGRWTSPISTRVDRRRARFPPRRAGRVSGS